MWSFLKLVTPLPSSIFTRPPTGPGRQPRTKRRLRSLAGPQDLSVDDARIRPVVPGHLLPFYHVGAFGSPTDTARGPRTRAEALHVPRVLAAEAPTLHDAQVALRLRPPTTEEPLARHEMPHRHGCVSRQHAVTSCSGTRRAH